MPLPVISIAQMRQWEKATWATGQTEAEVIRCVGKVVAQFALRLTHPGDLILILAGNGVIRGHGSRELTVLAERARIPVVTTFMAKGALPAGHPLARATVGLASDDPERLGFSSADLVIAVGYDPVEWAPARWNPVGRRDIVHLDFTPAEVDARYQPSVEIVADVREALELLAPLVALVMNTVRMKSPLNLRPQNIPEPSRPPWPESVWMSFTAS